MTHVAVGINALMLGVGVGVARSGVGVGVARSGVGVGVARSGVGEGINPNKPGIPVGAGVDSGALVSPQNLGGSELVLKALNTWCWS